MPPSINCDGSASANPTATPDGSDFSAAVPSPTSELSVNTHRRRSERRFIGANSSAIVPDVGEASDTVGGTLSTANSVGNIQVLTDASANSSAEPSAYVPPPSEPAPAGSQSEAPILAFTGDLGSGVGELAPVSSSTGSGTGSSGTGPWLRLAVPVQAWSSISTGTPVSATRQRVRHRRRRGRQLLRKPFQQSGHHHHRRRLWGNRRVALGSGALGESETLLTSVSYSSSQSALARTRTPSAIRLRRQACRPPVPSVAPVLYGNGRSRGAGNYQAPAPASMAMSDSAARSVLPTMTAAALPRISTIFLASSPTNFPRSWAGQ